MKYLSLLRHAEAEQPMGVNDKDRNLSSYGGQMAPRLGRRLEQRGFMPDIVISSPAVRALETARIFCYELGFAVEDLQVNNAVYRASLRDLMQLLCAIDEPKSHVLLVGHNPSLSELAIHLCGQTDEVPRHMATCSLVRLKIPIEYWAMIDSAQGQFLEYDSPEKMT